MSLTISLIKKQTNKLSWNKSVDKKISYLNENLVSCGIPAYQYDAKRLSDETQFPWMRCRASDLDYLKFIAAKLEENPSRAPGNDFVSQEIPPDLRQKFISENRSHLICHHNSFGDYVPVSFQKACLSAGFLSTIRHLRKPKIPYCQATWGCDWRSTSVRTLTNFQGFWAFFQNFSSLLVFLNPVKFSKIRGLLTEDKRPHSISN